MFIRKRARLLVPLMLMIAGVALLAIAAGCTSGASEENLDDLRAEVQALGGAPRIDPVDRLIEVTGFEIKGTTNTEDLAVPEVDPSTLGRIATRPKRTVLNCRLYELVTGCLPIGPSDDTDEAFRRIRNDSPIGPRAVNPKIPHEIEAIILHALSKDPVDRYESVAEFAADQRTGDAWH